MRPLVQVRPAGGRHRHRGGRCHGLPVRCGGPGAVTAQDGGAVTMASPVAAEAEVRLYVCVGKQCPGGRDVLAALRQAGAARKIAVDPCGCLDLCERGPVVIALPAGAPPPRKGQAIGDELQASFFAVTPEDAPRIIAALPGRHRSA